eukprot:COSAG04_NODE_9548_length_853_cov_0.933687_2_plen_103_part_01
MQAGIPRDVAAEPPGAAWGFDSSTGAGLGEMALRLALLALALSRWPSPSRAIPLRVGARVPQWGCGVGPSPHQSWRYDPSNRTFTVADRWGRPGAPPMCLTAE